MVKTVQFYMYTCNNDRKLSLVCPLNLDAVCYIYDILLFYFHDFFAPI